MTKKAKKVKYHQLKNSAKAKNGQAYHGEEEPRGPTRTLSKREERKVKKELARARVRGKWTKADAECRKELAKFQVQLYAQSLSIKDMKGDGNCLFRAFGDQLYQNQDMHPKIRETIMEYVAKHENDFAPFIVDMSFKEYVATMRKNGSWGGNLEIQAASMEYKINISIHRLNEPRWDVINWPGTHFIHLAYHDGDHYNSVHPIIKSAVSNASVSGNPENDTTEQEKRIMQVTNCRNVQFVRELLKKNKGDSDETIDQLCVMGPLLYNKDCLTAEEEEEFAGEIQLNSTSIANASTAASTDPAVKSTASESSASHQQQLHLSDDTALSLAIAQSLEDDPSVHYQVVYPTTRKAAKESENNQRKKPAKLSNRDRKRQKQIEKAQKKEEKNKEKGKNANTSEDLGVPQAIIDSVAKLGALSI